MLERVDLDEPPLRQSFGSQPLTAATRDYESRLTTWQAGQDRAVRAGGGF